MKVFIPIFVFAVSTTLGGRLENHYLPSNQAFGNSGNGLIQPPNTAFTAPATNYKIGVYNKQQRSPITAAGRANILKLENENIGDGSYKYQLETDNGIYQQEAGQLYNAGTDQEQNVVRGSYSFTAPDGVQYTVSYTADATGFHAEGAHLPVAPEIPEAILKSIELNAAAAAAGKSESRQYQEQLSGLNGAPAIRKSSSYSGSFNSKTGYNY